MKIFKTIPVFILLFTGYLCNDEETEAPSFLSPAKGYHTKDNSSGPVTRILANDSFPGRSLPTLVVAGVSIALVLLCILIVAVFWYAWKKSQEGSMELNPIPYGETGVSLQNL